MSALRRTATDVCSDVIAACGQCAGEADIVDGRLACARKPVRDCVLLRLVAVCREEERRTLGLGACSRTAGVVPRDWIADHAGSEEALDLRQFKGGARRV